MASKCAKCQNSVHNKKSLKCNKCKKSYHVECTNRAKLCELMTPEQKKQWICSPCHSTSGNTSNVASKSIPKKMHSQNITVRKKLATSQSNRTGEADTSETKFNTDVQTCIDNTKSPSSTPELHKNGHQSSITAEVNSYLPFFETTPQTPMKSSIDTGEISQKSRNNTPSKKYVVNLPINNSFDYLSEVEDSIDDQSIDEQLYNSSSFTPKYINPGLNRSCPNLATKNSFDVEILQIKLTELQQKYASAENEISNLSSENMLLKKKLQEYQLKINKLTTICTSTSSSPTPNCSSIKKSVATRKRRQLSTDYSITDDVMPSPPVPQRATTSSRPQKAPHLAHKPLAEAVIDELRTESTHSKICLISSHGFSLGNTTRCSLDIPASETCHYRMTGGGILQLFSGLYGKLKGFTYSDFCIIYIGETDFTVTADYISLIQFVREQVQSVHHTNVIICLPTFKLHYNANMYNKRVEHFNKLLYTDNLSYEYAYILDSNKNLLYTNYMFSRVRGSINKRGLHVIQKDLTTLIGWINCSTVYDCDTRMARPDESSCDSFFREY